MAKRIGPRIHNSFLDANFWNETGSRLEACAMLEILDLAQRGEVNLILPFSVKAELEHPNTPPEIKQATSGMIHTLRTELTPNELALRSKLLILIQGNAKPGKHGRDVLHLVESHKYGGGYCITKDDRLLKKSTQIEYLLTSLRVVRPSDFIKYFRSEGCLTPRLGAAPTLRKHAHLSKGDTQLREMIYKEYVIRPAPLPLTDGRWNHEVYVVRDRGYEVVERKFYSAATFAMRAEAVVHCIAFGKQIIDGRVPNCSADDL